MYQTNGALERSHSTLSDFLKHYINEKQTDWGNWIDTAMFSYNTTMHTSTKFSPHELVFGNKPELPTKLTETPEFKYTYDCYLDQLKLKLNKICEIAREHIIKSKEKSKIYYDKKLGKRPNFHKGDLILLPNESMNSKLSKKLRAKFNGPYEIVKINSPTNVTLKKKRPVVHVNRLKQFSIL